VAAVLLIGGDLTPWQTAAVRTGLPIAMVLLLIVYSEEQSSIAVALEQPPARTIENSDKEFDDCYLQSAIHIQIIN